MSYQSKYTGQEIDELLDNVGEVGVLDSAFCRILSDYVPTKGAIVPFAKISGNMDCIDGKITLKPGQRVEVAVTVAYKNKTETRSSIDYYLKDVTNGIEIQRMGPNWRDESYEQGPSMVCQYTNETDLPCELALLCIDSYTGGQLRANWTMMSVHEIGRAMVIDKELPVASTETLGGIKVGEGLEITEEGILNALSGKGEVTTLFEGRTETLATNYTLSDSINSYDMLVVQASLPKNEGLITTLPIINPQINKSYAMGNHHGNDNDAAYFLTFAFSSETTIQQLDRVGKGDEYWQNVSIDHIYGIKLGVGSGSSYKEVELLSEPVEIAISNAEVNQNILLLGNITDYHHLHIITDIKSNPSTSTDTVAGYYQHDTTVVNVGSVIYNDTDNSLNNGSRMNIAAIDSSSNIHNMCYWFKNPAELRVRFCQAKESPSAYSHFRIYSIKGIKY